MPLSAFDSVQSGVSYDASDAHTNMTTFSRSVSSTKPRRSWGCRSRFLPWVSPRALTLTQLDTLALGVLGGVSGLRVLHGLNRTPAKNVLVNSDKLVQDKIIEGTDISAQTVDDAVSFRVQPTDAHSRRLVLDDQSQPASEGLARTMFDRPAQRCCVVSLIWLRFQLNFDGLRLFRSTLSGRPSNDQDQPESSSQCFANPFFLSVVAFSSRPPT